MLVHVKMSLTIYPVQSSTSTQGHLASRLPLSIISSLYPTNGHLSVWIQFDVAMKTYWIGLHPVGCHSKPVKISTSIYPSVECLMGKKKRNLRTHLHPSRLAQF